MSTHADVVVIGAGIVGAATAFHLAKAGAGRVILLERRTLAAGATGKSGAVVRMHYTNPHDARLAALSLSYFLHWGDLVGSGDPGYVKTGVVRLVEPGQEDALAANVEMLKSVGVQNDLITRDELRALDPYVTLDDVVVAAYEPDSGYADPMASVRGFVGRAVELGVDVREWTEATAITMANGRVTGVETSAGPISTPSVVLAAGAYAPRLLTPLGLDFGLQANRVQVAIFRRLEDRPRLHPVYIDGTHSMWVRPEGAHSTLAGYGHDILGVDPDHFDEGVDADYLAEIRSRVSARIPSLAGAPMRGGWAGVITHSPDGHAIIDQIPSHPGLYCFLGDAGTNFKTAPAIGACLAEWVTGGVPVTADVRAFRSTRFAEGETVGGGTLYGEESHDVFR